MFLDRFLHSFGTLWVAAYIGNCFLWPIQGTDKKPPSNATNYVALSTKSCKCRYEFKFNCLKHGVLLCSEITHLLWKGKYHCVAVFGFYQTSKSVDNFSITKQLNPNQHYRNEIIEIHDDVKCKIRKKSIFL